jgi:NAD(P)-dependent dehydrogenase (short-subunit alcohol dehydrogenase family)
LHKQRWHFQVKVLSFLNIHPRRFMTVLNDDDSANAELKRTMDVNFMGAVYCTRAAYMSMMKRNAYGYIININSIDGHYVSESYGIVG